MFMLSEVDPGVGKALDIAGGPSSFRAEGTALHHHITACDPMYRLSPEEILAYGRASIARGIEDWEKNPKFPMSDDYKARKYASLETFVADYAANRGEGAYVHGELPHLPFADRTFDRVLSGNVLFAYAHVDHGVCYDGEEFDLSFHLRAAEEIARISRSEIRLVPVDNYAPPSRVHDYRDAVCARLEDLGCRCRLQPNEPGAVMSCYTHVLVAERNWRYTFLPSPLGPGLWSANPCRAIAARPVAQPSRAWFSGGMAASQAAIRGFSADHEAPASSDRDHLASRPAVDWRCPPPPDIAGTRVAGRRSSRLHEPSLSFAAA